jgi:Cdc6-like AAA superfamily ATPase
MFYAQWSRRDVRPRDPATHRLRVDARAIAPPEPREDDATNADGCRFRDSFKYTEGASFKVGDCVMVQLEGEGVREGESLRHAAAQILQIWWPAPEEDEDEDEPWAEVRWLYCAEEIVPAKRRPTPAAKYADREVFETTHVDEVPASSLMGCVEVLSYDAYVQRRSKEDRKAMKDVFFCRYVWEPGAQLTECGPASERCRRAQALCRKGRGVKRRGAAWDGDVVSDEERVEDDHLNSEPRDRLRRASNALQLSAAPKRLPCRENERDNIENFVLEMLSAPGGDGRTLYVAGMPGTGKTATVREVVRALQETGNAFRFVEVNAMRLPQPNHAYALLWEALTGEKRGADAAARLLDKRFSSGEEQEERVVVLVDELDYMLTQRQEVLYNLFEWPGRKNAGLAVIGIANTLDLPERLDPKVRSRLGSRRLTFATYKPAQIESILTQRLSAGDLSAAFQPQAVTMAARKIAAYSGDVRKALCICARATEVCAERADTARRAGDEATKEAQYVVTIADINNAYRLLSDSSYLGAIEHAAPLEQLVLIALCAELRARKSETAPLEDVARRLARLVALAGDAGDSSRPPTHGELLEIVDRFADARLLATEHLKRDDRFPALRLNIQSDIVADVLINASKHPLAERFLRD